MQREAQRIVFSRGGILGNQELVAVLKKLPGVFSRGIVIG
jgi:hypothetical protein